MKIPHFICVLMCAVALTACQTMQENPKETGGTLLGGGLGALGGSQIGSGKGQLVAVAIGALAGAYYGGEIGKSLDHADKLYAERTAQNSLEYGKAGVASTWRNPDTGHSGTTTPVRTFQTASGENCRDFETAINVDGKSETATGTACRQPDGTWKVVR